MNKTTYDIDVNPKCLSEISYKIGYFGGWPGALALGMISLFVVIVIFVLLMTRKRKNKNNGSMVSMKSMDKSIEMDVETSEDMSIDVEQKYDNRFI